MAESLESQVDAMQVGQGGPRARGCRNGIPGVQPRDRGDAAPHERLRAVAVMFSIAVQVAVPAATGITRIDQLRGRRVDVGASGGSVERAARMILDSYGVGYDTIIPTYGGPGHPRTFQGGQISTRGSFTPPSSIR